MIYSPLLKQHEVPLVDDRYFNEFSAKMEHKSNINYEVAFVAKSQ